MKKLQSVYLDEELIADLDLLATIEPTMEGRNKERIRSPFMELILMRYRDENKRKLEKLRKSNLVK